MIFVTALVDIQQTQCYRSIAVRIELFQKLVATGIRLCVFVDSVYAPYIEVPNGTVHVVKLNELETFKVSPPGLPFHRNEVKDTRDFLILMNAKTEFIKRCIEMYPDTHYAWVDGSIFHVLTDQAVGQLKELAVRSYPSKCLYFPGCIAPNVTFQQINWRFCGGFFVGDRDSLIELCDEHMRILPTLPNLCWEVNVWAYLESKGIHFDWYSGDHNNSILSVP